jgi:hypothetical protein
MATRVLLGCTLVDGNRCCCALDSNGTISEVLQNAHFDSTEPGTVLEFQGGRWVQVGPPGFAKNVLVMEGRPWVLVREEFDQYLPIGIKGPTFVGRAVVFRSPGIFDGNLCWYPNADLGGPISRDDRYGHKIPEAPGVPHEFVSKEVVITTFDLRLSIKKSRTRSGAYQTDLYYGCYVRLDGRYGRYGRMTVKFNGASDGVPPSVLPAGSVLGVFTSSFQYGNRWNPECQDQFEVGIVQYGFLRIGSIIRLGPGGPGRGPAPTPISTLSRDDLSLIELINLAIDYLEQHKDAKSVAQWLIFRSEHMQKRFFNDPSLGVADFGEEFGRRLAEALWIRCADVLLGHQRQEVPLLKPLEEFIRWIGRLLPENFDSKFENETSIEMAFLKQDIDMLPAIVPASHMVWRSNSTSIMLSDFDSQDPTSEFRRIVFEAAPEIRQIWLAVWDRVLKQSHLQVPYIKLDGKLDVKLLKATLALQLMMFQAIEAIAMAGFDRSEADAAEWLDSGGSDLIKEICGNIHPEATDFLGGFLRADYPSLDAYSKWVPELVRLRSSVTG